MSAGGRSPGACSGRITSDQRDASSGSGRSERTVMTCRGATARSRSRIGSARSSRWSSAISTFGRESDSPNSISGVVHQAFSPTAAAPSEVTAQNPITHSG